MISRACLLMKSTASYVKGTHAPMIFSGFQRNLSTDKFQYHLQQVGDAFLRVHKKMAPLHLEHIENVLIYHSGSIQLWKKKESVQYERVAQEPTAASLNEYKALKNYSHLAVGVSVVLSSMSECLRARAGDERRLRVLEALFDMATQLRLWKKDALFSNSFHELLDESRHALDSLFDQFIVPSSNRKIYLPSDYIAETETLLKKYANNAAKLQITSLDMIMEKWNKNYAIQPHKTKILIVVAHGPRVELIEGQYYKHWLKEKNVPSHERHIYHVEMLPSQMSSLDEHKDLIQGFLAEQELNRHIGETMLDDADAMFKDILSSHAPEILENLKSKKSSRCPFGKQ